MELNLNVNKNKNKNSITNYISKKTITIQQKRQKVLINEPQQLTTTNTMIESMEESLLSKLYVKGLSVSKTH